MRCDQASIDRDTRNVENINGHHEHNAVQMAEETKIMSFE